MQPKHILYFSLLLLIFNSCNNNNESNDPDKKSDQPSTTSKPLTAFDGNFPVLYIEFQKITDIMSAGQIKQITYQFNFNDATTGQPTLNGYGMKSNGKFSPPNDPPPGITLIKASPIVLINYPFNFNNLEFSINNYNVLNSDTNKKKYLIFTPYKTVQNSVSYFTSWNDIVPTIAITKESLSPTDNSINLNPSPPKDPY